MKALNKMYRLVKREKMQGNVIKCKYCGQSHERKKSYILLGESMAMQQMERKKQFC